MPTLSIRHQVLLGAFFMVLLIVTRLPQVVTSELGSSLIPISTIGVFFLMGVYFRQIWLLTLSFLIVWTMDITGMTWQANTDFCLRESYLFLLLSYSIYWAAGRLFANLYAGETLKSLGLLSLIAPIGAALGYLVTSVSFHYWSGLFEEDINQLFSDYLTRLPAHLEGLAVYLLIATLVHLTLSNLLQNQNKTQTA